MRVFLSSTYEDLIDEREAVYAKLRQEGHDVVRMEDFGGRSEVPLETCLLALETCEVYVLLLGSRYGTVEPMYNLSYTHIEYERACELEMWIHAYIREGMDEPDEGAGPDDFLRLRDFRSVIERSHTVRHPYFTSPEELADQVADDLQALAERIQVRPTFGRGQRAIDDTTAYAAGTVRFVRLRLNPFVVVVVDLGVVSAETYPEGRGRRMRRKVREIIAF